MNNPKVKVEFYFNKKNNDLFAFFPDIVERTQAQPFTNKSTKLFLCYSHVGQHSAVCKEYVKRSTRASEEQYNNLAEELISIGYNLQINN